MGLTIKYRNHHILKSALISSSSGTLSAIQSRASDISDYLEDMEGNDKLTLMDVKVLPLYTAGDTAFFEAHILTVEVIE